MNGYEVYINILSYHADSNHIDIYKNELPIVSSLSFPTNCYGASIGEQALIIQKEKLVQHVVCTFFNPEMDTLNYGRCSLR